MSETKRCPHCGQELEPNSDIHEHQAEPDAVKPSGSSVSSTSLIAPGSDDDTFLHKGVDRQLAEAELDPILSEFAMSGAAEPTGLPVGSELPTAIEPRSSSRTALFPAINLEPTSKNSAVQITTPPFSSPGPTTDKTVDHETEVEDEAEGGGWPSILLASYASAVTLALLWFVMKDRNGDKIETPRDVEQKKKTEEPRTAGLSTNFGISEPIQGEHFAKLGEPLKVGSLEITPIDVKRQDVKLVKNGVLSVSETKDGGKKALILRLKLTNLTSDTAFAPLDPLYLRARGDQLVDTYVTTANGERLYPFPLAIESDLSIVGQDFTELRPRESRVVSIVTAPDAPPETAGPFTWRVRLRTGVKQTNVIGLVWSVPVEPKGETKPD